MEEAAIHAMMLDRELATSFGKILNFRYELSGADHSGIVEAQDFQQALETPAARAIVTARQRFFSMPAGCLRRGGQFMSYQLLIAMATLKHHVGGEHKELNGSVGESVPELAGESCCGNEERPIQTMSQARATGA